MASLTGCIKKAGKVLSAEDKAAILKAAQEHRADGMKAVEAGRKAVADLLAQVQAELKQVEAEDATESKRMVLNQAARPFEQRLTEAFKRWSNDAPYISGEDAATHAFKTGEKIVVEAFHGTKRPDRVGVKFLKKRATSGPMAFHTSDPGLASTYASGKDDTSLAMEDQDYSNWFKVKRPGERSASDLVRAWYRLDSATKDKIAALAPRVTYSEEQEAGGGNKIVLGDESVTSGTGSYDYNLAATRTSWDRRGNPLKALIEDWLNSGNLFNDEERFMQVLKLAGFPMETVEYDSPTSEYPFVYKNYIAMQKPLVTSDIPQEVVDALNAAAKRDRSRAQSRGVDSWDKNTRTLREWVAAFSEKNDSTAYVWTSIPDKVTEVFKSLGYDGIIDWSGKGGGPGAMVAPVYIPFEETQVKSAIGNKGTFGQTNNILKQSGQAFYSALSRAVEGAAMKAAPASGWKDAIKGWISKGQVKADEVEWSGLNEWLALQDGKVTREQIAEYLRGNGVQVTETQSPVGESIGTQDFRTWQLPGGTAYREVLLTLPSMPGKQALGRRAVFDKYLPEIERIQAEQDAMLKAPQSQFDTTKFRALGDDLDAVIEKRDREAAATAGEMAEYRSNHWDATNVLAHIRVNDRVDASGARVLFVEELQSDWSQAGHKKTGRKLDDGSDERVGFRRPFAGKTPVVRGEQMTVGEFVALDPEGKDWLDRQNAVRADLNDPPLKDADPVQVIYEDGKISRATTRMRGTAQQWADQIARDWKRIRATEAQQWAASQEGKPPLAPFVENTDKWLALALKRIVKMAVDGGYDKVAFVTGEQSAERYDLSKQIERIDASPGRDYAAGVYDLDVWPMEGSKIVKHGLSAQEVEDLVGKDMAAKIVQSVDAWREKHLAYRAELAKTDVPESRLDELRADRDAIETDFSGDGLKVGGEGMRAFYDKIVPAATKDVLRKLGGGAMETTQVSSTKTVSSTTGPRMGRWDESVMLEQPSFSITDAMREKAADGLPMFQGGDKPRAQIAFGQDVSAAASVITLLDGADLSSFIHEAAHFFLEVHADIATKIAQQIAAGASVTDLERGIVDDFNTTLRWMGVTGLEDASGATGGALDQAAYHGTPYRGIEKFSTDAIGTGTGDQAFGWGLYFGGRREVGEYYRKLLTEGKTTGQLYEVEIPEDSEMLDWNKPLSEQPEGVRAALNTSRWQEFAYRADGTPRNMKGEDLYRTIAVELGDSERAASESLSALGIRGIKYRGQAAFDRGTTGPANYVIFDGADAAIRQTFYQGGQDQGPPEAPRLGRTPLDTWAMMSLAEKMPYHEKFARGFEAYAFEGKAPSLALQGVFNRFRAWLKDVYRWLLKEHKNRLDAGLNAKLSDDIRGVMDRMIATDEAIEEAEAARGFLPLFKTAEEAAKFGWSPEKWQKYQALGHDATDDAKAKLSERALKDMKWLGRARDKALKARQQEVEEQRREVRAEIRMEVYSEPVYRAWQFLTVKGDSDETAKGEGKDKASRSVDVTKDSLLVAIAKLGGIARDSAKRDLSVNDDDLKIDAGVFGAPVFRKTGGRNADDMREALTELGYIHERDEFGRTDLKGLSDAVSDEIGGSPQYSFQMDYGAPVSNDKIGEGQFYGKLNTEDMRLRYGNGADAIWRKLSALRMTSDTGLDADVVAEFFEFDSGDALVRALVEAVPPREAIEARTDERMLQMFGDITSPEALARAADEAVMNKVRAKFLASEWKALEDATTKKEKRGKRSVDLMAIAAKEYAAQIVARLKVRDIKPAKYAAAAARNGKLSAKAFTSAKLEEAAMHKRNQTVNAYAADAAYEALHEVEKARAYLRKFDKRIKSIEPAYQDQINAILERFDLRKASRDEAAKARAEARTQAQIAAAQARLDELDAADPTNERAALADWIASLDPDKGDVIPALSEAVLNEANRKSYKDMTLEELRGMVDDVRQLEHLGRTKNRLLKSKAKRDLDEYADDASASIRKSKDVRGIDREGEPAWRDHSADALATMRKMSSLARQMDAGDESGPLFEGLIRPANEAGAWADERLSKEHAELLKIVSEVAALPGGLTGRKVRTPLGVSLTRGAQLAVLLNAGNEVNLQRMEAGDGWSMAQVQALAAAMTPTELNFVNKTWAYLETFWPEVQALEKRMTGVAPEKVEAAPWVATASDGTKITMTGGYYPIVYSRDLNDATAKQESAKELMEAARGAVSRGMTRHSHTKKRAEKVARKLKLNLDVISSHVEQVVHDLAWREWVTDANRILNHKDISLAIHEHYGPRVLQAMREQVAAIATGDIKPRDAWHKSLMWARNNTSRAVMGFSATTAFLQPFGMFQSAVRLGGNEGAIGGAKWLLKGYRRWVGDAADLESSMKWITDKSTFMKHRAKTFNREVKELNRVMEGKSKAADVLDTALFFAMQKMQLVADIPTWIGQYEKTLQEAGDRAKAEGRFGDEVLEEIEAEAVAQADRAVIESQGSGEVKDLAGVQRNWPMLTMFYSYFSATWQMTAESTARTNFRNPRAVAGWLADMLLLNVVPAIGPALLLMFLKGMGDDDEENERKLAEKAAEAQFSYLVNMIPLVREAQGVFGPFDYQGPPVGMIVGALGKAAKQTEQVAAAYLEGDADAAFENMDEAFVKSYIRLLGLSFGLPVVQAQRMWDGWKAWDEGREGAGPQSVLFGPPAK